MLLPPGYFKVLGVYRSYRSEGMPVVDVAYAPLPEYVRRGVLPRANAGGRVVAKTVRGNRLVLDDPTLAALVKQRRNRIVAGTRPLKRKLQQNGPVRKKRR